MMNRISTLLAIALIATVAFGASCPADCSGNGECYEGVCECDTNYEGADCSYYVQTLTNGEWLTDQTVSARDWQFFKVITHVTDTIVFTMNLTDSGEADMFVNFDAFPTALRYVEANRQVEQLSVVTVTDGLPGSYYLGIAGFSDASFSVRVDVNSGGCPGDGLCSGEGSCVNGACVCEDNHVGYECESHLTVLANGVEVTDQETGYRKFDMYFGLNVTDYAERIFFQVTPTAGQADLYLKWGSIPTSTSFDAANATDGEVSIRIDDLDYRTGMWYAGVYGYEVDSETGVCSYSIVAEQSLDCAGASVTCSGHGTPRSDCTCECEPGFSDDQCETMDAPLELGVTVDGYVESGSWNYFTFHDFTAEDIVFTVEEHTNTGDSEIFVRVGSQPTTIDFDYSETTTARTYTLTITESTEDTLYVGIYGSRAVGYNLTVIETSECESCVNGKCYEGICVCDSTHAGQACDQSVVDLVSGVKVTANQVKARFDYYRLNVVDTSAIHISINEKTTTGDLWLYAYANEAPTLQLYDVSDKATRASVHHVEYVFDTPVTGEYYIAVYGSPFILSGQVAMYDIVAWASPF